MSKKACVNCGTFFIHFQSNRKFCKLSCRYSYNNKHKRNNKPYGITLPYIPERFIIKENSLGEHKSLGELNETKIWKIK